MAATAQRNCLDIQLVHRLSRDFPVASHDENAPFQSAAATSRNGYPAQAGRPADSGMRGLRSSSAGLPHGHDDRTKTRQARQYSARTTGQQELNRFAQRPHLSRIARQLQRVRPGLFSLFRGGRATASILAVRRHRLCPRAQCLRNCCGRVPSVGAAVVSRTAQPCFETAPLPSCHIS
jgi:hypothetical protein